jgi:hypothetical protein
MILPRRGITTSASVATAVASPSGRPALLYIAHTATSNRRTSPPSIATGPSARLSTRPFARRHRARDDYLRRLTQHVDPRKIVNGIGEQPAVVHLRDFKLGGYQRLCVRGAAAVTREAMLAACFAAIGVRRNGSEASSRSRTCETPSTPIRACFHEAVEAAGIAATERCLLPLLSNVGDKDRPAIAAAALSLRSAEA